MEVHQALQAAMDKLQQRFTSLMQEKVDLKERVEELEHRCIQLSGETDTIGEAVAVLVTDGSSRQRPLTVLLMPLFLWRSLRGVHCPVSEPACNHEAETPREGAVHQHAGPGQGGDEGTAKRRFDCLDFDLVATITAVQPVITSLLHLYLNDFVCKIRTSKVLISLYSKINNQRQCQMLL